MKSYWLVNNYSLEVKFDNKKDAQEFFNDAINQLNNCKDEDIHIKLARGKNFSEILRTLEMISCKLEMLLRFVEDTIDGYYSFHSGFSKNISVVGNIIKIKHDLKSIHSEMK